MAHEVLGTMYKNFAGQYMVLFNTNFNIAAIRADRMYFVISPEGEILQGQLKKRHTDWRTSTVYMEIPMMLHGDYTLIRAVLASDNEACIVSLKEMHKDNDNIIMVPYEWNKSQPKVLIDGLQHEIIRYITDEELDTLGDSEMSRIVRTDYGDAVMVSHDAMVFIDQDRINLNRTHMANQLIVGKVWNDECTVMMLDKHIRHYHLMYNGRYAVEGRYGGFYDGHLVPDADGAPRLETSHGKCFILASESIMGIRPTVTDAAGVVDPSEVPNKK